MITDRIVTIGLLGIMMGSLSYNRICDKLGRSIVKQKVLEKENTLLKRYNEKFKWY